MKSILSLLLLVIFLPSFSQESYFQQEVNYKIDVKLDDENHFLHASEEIEYINNSPSTMEFIYFHLWPNAYKGRTSEFYRQEVRNGSSRFHYADDEIRGYIDSLDFMVNGKSVQTEDVPDQPDIIKLILNEPLSSGSSITISTPFRVKIPDSFSRLGHVKQQYQITQWYPKPAVYDKNGWNEMPYLDMGEFYSEFGKFEVSITVPSNYVVGATGNLQNESEWNFLDSIAAANTSITDIPPADEDTFPPSSQSYKTLTYIQDNIHDFAWFADKRYTIKKGEVTLPESGRKVTLWAMFNVSNSETWEDIIEYMHDGVYYYSKWIGDYPYDVVTVIDGALSAGSGMEYPTITVLGAENKFLLEQVTVHEIGHNWFYGILASNERKYAWMDEGLNTYYEMRYFKTKYPDIGIFGLDRDSSDGFGFKVANYVGVGATRHHRLNNLAYQLLASYNRDQPNCTHSNHFVPVNYGVISYQKTGAQLDYLYEYLGEETYDECMQSYYATWKFKHPQPEDLEAVFKEKSGKDLDWLFDDFLTTTKKLDYRISRVRKLRDQVEVTIENSGEIVGPVSVALIDNDEEVESVWLEGFEDQSTISLSGTGSQVKLFNNQNVPDLWPSNNIMKTEGMFKGFEPLKVKPLWGIPKEDQSYLYLSPTIGSNSTDQFMLGAAFYNYLVQNKRFQYILNPMFSFGRTSHAGYYDLSYQWLPNRNFESIKLGIQIQDFADMQKVAPRLEFNFKADDPAFKPKQKIVYTHHFMWSELPLYEDQYQVGRLTYDIEKQSAIYFSSFQTKLISDYEDFASLELTGEFFRSYKRGRYVRFRGYAGGILSGTPGIFALNFSGSPDFTMDQIFLDRAGINENVAILQRQTDLEQGGMRGLVGSSHDSMIVTFNTDVDMPFSNRVRFFFDQGWRIGNQPEYYYTTGLSLNVGGIIYFYLPVAGHSYLDSTPGFPESFGDFADNIRFSLRLDRLNPWNLIESNI